MAESQVPFAYTDLDFTALRAAMSEDRFATYLALAKRDARHAFDLYLYNARLAKAFLFPLSAVEITLRNAMDAMLVELHGQDWPTDPGLRAVLTPESASSLDKAIVRTRISYPTLPRGQVVATLSFDFWSNLFRPEYDRAFWQVNLRKVLPHCPATETRPDVQVLVRDINRFRNRIAHHEPILKVDVTALHAAMLRLIGYRCPKTAAWVKHHSTISSTIRTKPKAGAAERRAIERCDVRFQSVAALDTLFDVMRGYRANVPAIVCLDGRGEPAALLAANDIMTFATSQAAAMDGMVSFADHTVADVIAAGVAGRWDRLDVDDPIAHVADRFMAATDLRGIVVTETVAGSLVPRGAILRSHRRY